jgi:hypothetical protein
MSTLDHHIKQPWGLAGEGENYIPWRPFPTTISTITTRTHHTIPIHCHLSGHMPCTMYTTQLPVESITHCVVTRCCHTLALPHMRVITTHHQTWTSSGMATAYEVDRLREYNADA